MDATGVVFLGSSFLALAVVVYLFWKSEKTPTLTELEKAFVQTQSLAEELNKVGLMGVAAAEQLKTTGKIDTNEEAFNVAFDYIATWPGLEHLDRKQVARAVEGSYRIYKEMVQGGKPAGN